jgi:hypothetical protein
MGALSAITEKEGLSSSTSANVARTRGSSGANVDPLSFALATNQPGAQGVTPATIE